MDHIIVGQSPEQVGSLANRRPTYCRIDLILPQYHRTLEEATIAAAAITRVRDDFHLPTHLFVLMQSHWLDGSAHFGFGVHFLNISLAART